ncbi:MAG: Hsp20/alpha crystallin family protein [Candidatus Hodarchaeales archaeon]
MAIQLWNPISDIIRQDDEFNRIFDIFSGFDDLLLTENWKEPFIEYSENEKEIIIKSELPGFNKKDIEIESTPEYIVIRAESKKESDSKDKEHKVLFKERSTRSFVRKIAFRNPVDVKKAKTTYKKGVLTVKLPKMKKEEAIKLIPE